MIANSNQQLPLADKVVLLKSLGIFKETPEPTLFELALLMKEVSLEAGTVIFREDDHGDCMYIIYSGDIQIHVGKTTVAVLHEKEVVGELSLLDAEPRSATAIAKTDCVLFKIEQEAFYELINSRPEIARGFIKILCNRLRQLNQKAAQGSI